jgi:hypothetical protein
MRKFVLDSRELKMNAGIGDGGIDGLVTSG